MFAPVLQLECTEAREGAAALQADYDELRQQRFAEQVRVSPVQTLAQTMTTNADTRLSAASRAAKLYTSPQCKSTDTRLGVANSARCRSRRSRLGFCECL